MGWLAVGEQSDDGIETVPTVTEVTLHEVWPVFCSAMLTRVVFDAMVRLVEAILTLVVPLPGADVVPGLTRQFSIGAPEAML